MIGGPTVQRVEIGHALLDQTNNLGIHDRAAFDASGFFDNARVTLRPAPFIVNSRTRPSRIWICSR
jgi:hypothetical protein